MKDENTYSEEKITYSIVPPPTSVGGYRITGKAKHGIIKFMFPVKPNAFNRFFVKLFLGWHWEDDNVTELK